MAMNELPRLILPEDVARLQPLIESLNAKRPPQEALELLTDDAKTRMLFFEFNHGWSEALLPIETADSNEFSGDAEGNAASEDTSRNVTGEATRNVTREMLLRSLSAHGSIWDNEELALHVVGYAQIDETVFQAAMISRSVPCMMLFDWDCTRNGPWLLQSIRSPEYCVQKYSAASPEAAAMDLKKRINERKSKPFSGAQSHYNGQLGDDNSKDGRLDNGELNVQHVMKTIRNIDLQNKQTVGSGQSTEHSEFEDDDGYWRMYDDVFSCSPVDGHHSSRRHAPDLSDGEVRINSGTASRDEVEKRTKSDVEATFHAVGCLALSSGLRMAEIEAAFYAAFTKLKHGLRLHTG